jgi:hypothetical protein
MGGKFYVEIEGFDVYIVPILKHWQRELVARMFCRCFQYG